MVINQSYWSITLRLYTAESASISRSYFWDGSSGAGIETLTFTYDNAPMLRHQQRSPRHLGTCVLRPGNRRLAEIEGMYFTDRYTQGALEMTLVGHDGDAGSFVEAGRRRNDLLVKQAKKSGGEQ